MKKILGVLAAAACFTIACNNNKESDSIAQAEKKNETHDSAVTLLGIDTDSMSMGKDFLAKAASGNMLEVQLGKLAQTNAAAAPVKAFGKMMEMDHTQANMQLMLLAKAKQIAVPSVPGNDAQDHINKLQTKKGAEFDKDYVNLMVDDHKEDIDEFQKAADKAKDPDIKAFAAKTLPILKEHLQKIQAIQSSMK